MARSLRANSIVGPFPGSAGRWVGRPRGRRRDAGRQARRGPERLGVDARGVEPDRRQAGADLLHERRRPAHVGLGIARRLELGEQRRGEAARRCRSRGPRGRPGRGGCSRRGCGRSGARRGARGPRRRRGGRGRCARRAATRSPDRSAPAASAWSMARTGVAPIPALISSTGASRPVEDEGAARRRDVELVADGEPGVQIAAGGAVVFALDGDPVVAGTGRSRERVVAEQRPLVVVGLDAQREVLAGACGAGAARRRDPRGGWRSPSRSRARSR